MRVKMTKRPRHRTSRRGIAAVWTAVSLTVLVGFTALAVDVGYTYKVRAELQRTADAAAMAAASQLADSDDPSYAAVKAVASQYCTANRVANQALVLADSDVILGRAVIGEDGRFGFNEGADPADAVKVRVRMSDTSPNGPLALFFGAALGVPTANVGASATATLVPRDIVIVIDLSNSMSYDSQLKHEGMTEINIRQVWQDLGSPTFGNMTVFHNDYASMPKYSTQTSTWIKSTLGLNNVPYPYPGGSWDEYINYVKSTLPSRSYPEKYYGYRFGLRTWVHYLLDYRHLATETPALKNCRVQPTHSLKQAVEELCNYLTFMDSTDQVALVSYCDYARKEMGLTLDYSQVIQHTYARQAGEYGSYTNISDGMQKAIDELNSVRARSTAKKVMVLMTDGNANRPTSESYARSLCYTKADICARQHIQIYAISLGAEADTSLMADLAEIGKGIHFYVPGGEIAQYSEDLRRVFRTLGGKRPVRLIE